MNKDDKRYPITCPHCKKEIYACRSFGMILGLMKEGYGTCVSCKQTFMLSYDKETDSISTSIDRIAKAINERHSETMS